jgi:hypothetical protein
MGCVMVSEAEGEDVGEGGVEPHALQGASRSGHSRWCEELGRWSPATAGWRRACPTLGLMSVLAMERLG